jgi:DNA-binding NtrC family response regulator
LKLRFVLIDNQPGIRGVLREYLMYLGHEVVCADACTFDNACIEFNGNHELACADGYFVDYTLSNMTGIEYLENKLQRACNCPAKNMFLMSGNFSQNVIDRAKSININLLDKPFQLNKISEFVAEISARVDTNRKLADLSANVAVNA